MKRKLASISLCSSILMHSQIGNVGINTVLPGSTFTINGSLAANYKSLSSSTVLGINDFYTAYNGSDFVVAPGGYTMIISKGTETGTTWEVALLLNKLVNTVGALSATDNITFTGQAFTDFNNSIPQVIPFSTSNQVINQGRAVSWNDSEDCWDVLESGVYKIEGYSYFGCGGPVSGTGSFTGINLVILKNGKTISNIIGGNRLLKIIYSSSLSLKEIVCSIE
jgi:hypothetical protein